MKIGLLRCGAGCGRLLLLPELLGEYVSFTARGNSQEGKEASECWDWELLDVGGGGGAVINSLTAT